MLRTLPVIQRASLPSIRRSLLKFRRCWHKDGRLAAGPESDATSAGESGTDHQPLRHDLCQKMLSRRANGMPFPPCEPSMVARRRQVAIPAGRGTSIRMAGFAASACAKDHQHLSDAVVISPSNFSIPPLPSAPGDCYNSMASARLHDGIAGRRLRVEIVRRSRGTLPCQGPSSPPPCSPRSPSPAAAQDAKPADPAPLQLTAQQDHKLMMEALKIKSLRPGANGMNRNAPNAANYDESKANPYPNLPDPLVLKDGEKVTTARGSGGTSGGRRSSRTSTARSTAASPRTCPR